MCEECITSILDGVNARSIVILDNAPIHHVAGIIDIIQRTGALVQSSR